MRVRRASIFYLISCKYLSGVLAGLACTEELEKQPTNFGMLVAEVDLINSLGRGVMYDLDLILSFKKLTISNNAPTPVVIQRP